MERTEKHIVLTVSVRGETGRKVEGALYGRYGIEWGRQTFCKRQESKYVPILKNTVIFQKSSHSLFRAG